MSYKNGAPRLETPSPTPENNGQGETSTEDTDQKVDASSDATGKDAGKEQNSEVVDRGSETDSSSDTVDDGESEHTPTPDSRTELAPEHELANLIPNGNVESEANETSTPLISTAKSSSSKIPWRRTHSKSADDNLATPVHTEARLSSADFNVAVVTYKRSVSQDYTKIDVHDQDDDEDHSELYGDISTSWATSFWTQFSVLMVRTFKQSKPDILSKLNFIQVSRNSMLY